MPLTKIQLRPGLVRDTTSYANEGGWFYSDKIRFRSGSPEKIGGWSFINATPYLGTCTAIVPWASLAGAQYCAAATNIKYYVEYGSQLFDITPFRKTAAAGSLINNPINTTNLLKTIKINVATHGALVGDYVVVSGATGPINSIPATDINKEQVVTNVIDANNFEVTVATTATGSGTGGGAAVAVGFEINTGLATYVSSSVGWGVGTWGSGTWSSIPIRATHSLGANPITTVITSNLFTVHDVGHGAIAGDIVIVSGSTAVNGVPAVEINTTHTVVSVTGPNDYVLSAVTVAAGSGAGGGAAVVVQYFASAPASPTQLRLWSQGTFGEDLVFCPWNGGLYYWDTSAGTSTRGVPITTMAGASDVPVVAVGVIITDSRHVVALGCNPYASPPNTAQDPMLVRWSDTESAVNWTPTPTNTAGGQRLSLGSKIVCARNARLETLIWTDTALYSMTFIGGALEFGFNLMGTPISIMSPNAVAIVGGTAYWMGNDKFYMYNGTVTTLPCPMIKLLLSNLNHSQTYLVHAGTNEQFGEATWFYPSTDSTVVDSYMTYNYVENLWYFGTMNRSAWADSGVRQYPMAADSDHNVLVYHEFGIDDNSTTTSTPFTSFIESSDFDLGDGQQFMFITRIVPDVDFQGSTSPNPSVTITLKTRNTPGNNWAETSPNAVTESVGGGVFTSPLEQFTPQLWVRLRGRQAALRIESNAAGVQWQLGATRLDIRPDGRR